MVGEKRTITEATSKATNARQRSTIGFPYMDLNAAVEMAQAIHGHVGLGEADDDQLALWTNQSAKSSTFRVQVYASRTFGVIEGDGGHHKLTDIGRMVVDPSRAREGRVKAFLAVPLYKAVYEKYKGGTLPPAAALEREITQLGVSDKQKERARQILERSAEQAAFFEHGKGRLVAPGIMSGQGHVIREQQGSGAGGGSGGGSGALDPLIAALIQKLPSSGKPWLVDDRISWLQMASMAFQMVYGPEQETIEIKKAHSVVELKAGYTPKTN